MRLYGRLESADGTTVRFSDDLAERLAFADRWFDERFARCSTPTSPLPGSVRRPTTGSSPDDFVRRPRRPNSTSTPAGIGAVVWATGYRLDFGWVDLPVLDEWGYPATPAGSHHPPRPVRGGFMAARHPPCRGPHIRTLPAVAAAIGGVGAGAAHMRRAHRMRRRS